MESASASEEQGLAARESAAWEQEQEQDSSTHGSGLWSSRELVISDWVRVRSIMHRHGLTEGFVFLRELEDGRSDGRSVLEFCVSDFIDEQGASQCRVTLHEVIERCE